MRVRRRRGVDAETAGALRLEMRRLAGIAPDLHMRPVGAAPVQNLEGEMGRKLRAGFRHMRKAGEQGVGPGARRVAPREIVDATVALGLAEDGDDRVGIDAPRRHRRLESRDVVGRARGQPMHVGAARHGRLAITARESATAPNTPPCIVTILIAAR